MQLGVKMKFKIENPEGVQHHKPPMFSPFRAVEFERFLSPGFVSLHRGLFTFSHSVATN
jgi:hypothetical protein